MKKHDWSKLAWTSLLGVILSYAFVFLAALPIRSLRLNFGRSLFLATTLVSGSILLAFGLWQWAVVYFSLSILIGLYREMEECQTSVFTASLAAIGLTSLTTALGLLIYSKISGLQFKSLLLERAQPLLEQMQKMPRFEDASAQTILWYLPSGLIITLMLVVFISLSLDREPDDHSRKENLIQFRLPDAMIWVFIASLAGAFLLEAGSSQSLIAMNVLVICMGAYFFQGLAVFTYFLNRFRIYGFWRLLAYFIVFFQMFIVVSGLGLLDFWLDFRSRGQASPQRQRIH